jgi:hypothetical protein
VQSAAVQVFKPLAGPGHALPAGTNDQLLWVSFSPLTANPAGTIAGDGLNVGLVGLQLHGARLEVLL